MGEPANGSPITLPPPLRWGGACWRAFLAVLGEQGLFHVYHRMGIDNGIGLWYHVSGGRCVRVSGLLHHFYLDYHRMGIDSAGILCYIGSTEVNHCVPSGQLEPISMKQRVGFFFYLPDAVRRFYDK